MVGGEGCRLLLVAPRGTFMRLAEGKWLRILGSFVRRVEKREMVLVSKGR